MSQTIESLWPDQIRNRVFSPSTILKAQGEALARQTGGVLLGEIRRDVDDEKNIVSLAFNIVVPALDNYRHRVLDVFYSQDLVYPAIVDAEVLRPTSSMMVDEFSRSGRIGLLNLGSRADSDKQLIGLVEKVLRSPQVLAAAQSLLARASDVLSDDSDLLPASPIDEPSTAGHVEPEAKSIDTE